MKLAFAIIAGQSWIIADMAKFFYEQTCQQEDFGFEAKKLRIMPAFDLLFWLHRQNELAEKETSRRFGPEAKRTVL